MGTLGALTHGSSIVFPSDSFDSDLVLDAILAEKCTCLLGVPTMFLSEIQRAKKRGCKIDTLRIGLVAGAPVPPSLVKQAAEQFNIKTILNGYGMTETSPVSFMTTIDDPDEKRLKTVGRILPHTRAKVIDKAGKIVARGVPGELCVSGFTLQKGYWKNENTTAEVMITDADGIRWMHTGDQCIIDQDGYCMVTGREKDIIIRGMYSFMWDLGH